MDDPLEQSLDPLTPGSQSSGGRDLLPQQMFSSSERVAQRVGEFWIRAHLGRGAMGQVFLVEHMAQGGMYALKLLPDEMVTDEESLARFAREAEALKILGEHPAIVTVYGTGRTKGGSPYYVMDYVEGQTLKEAFKQGMPTDAGLDVIDQVADALSFAHGRNLIHRDLKPDNVLLNLEGKAQLVDFGLVRAITQGADAARLTQAGQALGTPAYMAPEQTSSEEAGIGPWTDVWGLGVLAYETLTQQTPYSGSTPLEIYTQLFEGAPIQSPRALGAKVKPKLEAVVMKALAHKGSERYPDATAFLQAFRAARQSATRVADSEEDEAPRSSKKGPVLAFLALVSIGLMGGAMFHAQSLAKARKANDASLTQVADLLKQGDLEGAAAELEEAGSAAKDVKLKGRYDALVAELASRRSAEKTARDELEALFAKGEVEEARQHYSPGQGASPNTAWVLALNGDYVDALRMCPPGTAPAARARLAAWANDLEACAGALAATGGARSLALAAELRAYLPDLGPPKAKVEPDDPWTGLARVEEALARGDVASALLNLGEAPSKPDPALRLSWRLAKGRLALALGDRKMILAAGEAIKASSELHPLDRGRALAWKSFLGRLAAESEGQAELARYGPGVPLAKALRNEPSPWWGGTNAARIALAAGEQDAARAALTRAGATRSELLPSPLSALRALAARGRDGVHGLLTTRVRALSAAGVAGPSPRPIAEAEPLIEVALRVRPEDPLALWAEANLARSRGREILVSAEAVQGVATKDIASRLLVARAHAAQEEGVYLRWLSARIEGDATSFAPSEDVLGAFAEAAAGRGPVARTAKLELLELICRRHSAVSAEAQAPLRAKGLQLAGQLAGLDLGPILAARAELAAALRGGDATQAEEAAGRLAEAAEAVSGDTLQVLRLRSQLGDSKAPDAARAYLALAGDLPGFAELRARRARRETDEGIKRRALVKISAWVPEHQGLILAREFAGLDPTSTQPLGGSIESLLSLGEVIALGPEQTRLVLALLRSRIDFLSSIRPEQIKAPGRPLVTWLARALLVSAQVGPGDAPRLERAREALATIGEALAVDPAHPAAHLLRLEVLAIQPTWATKALAAEISYSVACARGALPWSPAALLGELALTPAGAAASLIDELLAQGFLSQKDLAAAVFAREPLLKHRPALKGALETISRELKPLVLRHHPPERVAMSAYELSVRAYSAKLPLTSLSLRLRTGADVAFDFTSIANFERSLGTTLPGQQSGQRSRVLADYYHWLAQQIAADPDLNDLDEEEKAKREAAKAKVWNQRAAQALLKGLADRPLGARLSFSVFMGLGYRGLTEDLEQTPVLREALSATQPEGRELLKSWVRRWDPIPLAGMLHVALPHGSGAVFSPQDLAEPFGYSQALLWDAQRPSVRRGLQKLATAEQADELVLLLLRSAAFDRGRTPTETFYWNVNPTFRLHGEGLDTQRAALARDLYRAAQVLTERPIFFKACEGDAIIDLASALEGDKRTSLAAEGLKLVEALKPALVPPHLESGGSAWWRVARARALAGDAAGAAKAVQSLRDQGWNSMWGLDQSLGADPAAKVLKAQLPEAARFFQRYEGGEDGEDPDSED